MASVLFVEKRGIPSVVWNNRGFPIHRNRKSLTLYSL